MNSGCCTYFAMSLLLVLCCILAEFYVTAQAFQAPKKHIGVCNGILRLTDSRGKTLEFEQKQRNFGLSKFKFKFDVRFKAVTVYSQGCGCFRLFKGRNFNKKSFRVHKNELQKIPIGKVGSIVSEKC